jgi:hypothetical protein
MFEFILFAAVMVLISQIAFIALSSGGGGYSARDNAPKVPPVGGSATAKVRPLSDRTELGEPPTGGRK